MSKQAVGAALGRRGVVGVAGVVAVQDGDLDGHPVEVDHAPDGGGGAGGGQSLVQPVDVVVQGALGVTDQPDAIAFLKVHSFTGIKNLNHPFFSLQTAINHKKTKPKSAKIKK